MIFEATARFILLFDSSGWLRLLSISRSSRNLSIVYSSRCLRFSKPTIACCPCTPEPKRFNKISKVFSTVSRCYWFLAITQFRAVPSKLLVSALHSCLSEKSSSSKCSFIFFDPGINTAIRFVFVASWFLKNPSGIFATFIGSR